MLISYFTPTQPTSHSDLIGQAKHHSLHMSHDDDGKMAHDRYKITYTHGSVHVLFFLNFSLISTFHHASYLIS